MAAWSVDDAGHVMACGGSTSLSSLGKTHLQRARWYIRPPGCHSFVLDHDDFIHLHPIMTSLLPDTMNPATLLSGRFRPDQIPDLSGRVAIVTGGSAGIGYYDALALARANARVIIVSANAEHGREAEADLNKALKEANSTGSVKWYGVEFGTLKDVDTIAKKLAGELDRDRLDILICNAGVGQAPYGLSNDGLERHFEVSDTHIPT